MSNDQLLWMALAVLGGAMAVIGYFLRTLHQSMEKRLVTILSGAEILQIVNGHYLGRREFVSHEDKVDQALRNHDRELAGLRQHWHDKVIEVGREQTLAIHKGSDAIDRLVSSMERLK